MKKIVILFALLFSLSVGHSSASSNLKIFLFDEFVNMDNPVIINGNTLVPLRVLFESLGASVSWDDQSKTVAAKKGNTNLFIQIGNKDVIKNGSTVILEEPATVINDKTYVPLRFVAESFNQDVRWDSDNNAIYIGKALTAKDISKLAAPAVVYIETYDSKYKPYATGSGFIIDQSGIVVTNYHVINNAFNVTVKLTDGSIFSVVNVINYDASKDIAILKIGSNKSLPTVNLGNSDKIETGDNVFAIGNPKFLENTISTGIISNKSRFDGSHNLIQISAAITHGSSGGALLNNKGEVIGITSSGYGEADLNFAIPINEISTIRFVNKNLTLEQIYNNEHVIYYTDATYVGDKKINVPHGFGTITWKNGDQYIGEFVNGARSGKGKYTWPNGASYNGDWVNGLKQGFGTDIDFNCNIFEGQFINGLSNGKGKISYSNGDVFYCDFLNGLANGYGTYYYANGTVSRNLWSNNKIIQ